MATVLLTATPSLVLSASFTSLAGIGSGIKDLFSGGEAGNPSGGGRGSSNSVSSVNSGSGERATQTANNYDHVNNLSYTSSNAAHDFAEEIVNAVNATRNINLEGGSPITVNVALEGGVDRLFRVVKAEAIRNEQITGVPAFSLS